MSTRSFAVVTALFLVWAPTVRAMDVGVSLKAEGQDSLRVAAGGTFNVDVTLTAAANMVSAQLMLSGDGNYFSATSATWAGGWTTLLDLKPHALPTGDMGAHAADLTVGSGSGLLVTVAIKVDAATPEGTYEITPQTPIVGDMNYDNANIASTAGLTVVVTASAGVAPSLVNAVSRKAHGAAGTFGIDVTSGSAVESRSGGPTEVVATFDAAIQALGLASGDVTASTGAISALAINGTSLSIEMSGAADAQPLTVAFPGIAAAADASQTVTSTLCLGVLAGDVTGDQTVNIFDLIGIRNVLNQPVTEANFTKDVNADGAINIFDMAKARLNVNVGVDKCP